MGFLLALVFLLKPICVVAACVAAVLWFVNGFPTIPWVSGIIGGVTVGCIVMLAKGPKGNFNGLAALFLVLAVDALLVAGLMTIGFTPAFVTWGVAHLVGIPVSSLFVFVASGISELGAHEDEAASWILTRGLVFGVASIVGVIAFAGV